MYPFITQKITIQCRRPETYRGIKKDYRRKIIAEVKGGLAYHLTVSTLLHEGEDSDPEWTVTHVATGLSCGKYFSKEIQAIRFLDSILPLTDWTESDMAVIRAAHSPEEWKKAFSDAYFNAIKEFEVMQV